jgi:hypothetical protein
MKLLSPIDVNLLMPSPLFQLRQVFIKSSCQIQLQELSQLIPVQQFLLSQP